MESTQKISWLTHEHQVAGKPTADLSAAVESYPLFPMTDKILNEKEQQELAEKFESVERNFGLDFHHRLERMAATLAENAQGA